MNTTAKARRFTVYTLVALIVKMYLLGALTISFGHIITFAAMLGLVGWQAYTVPFFVDGFALLGMIGRTDAVANRTEDPEAVKRFGFRLQLAAGFLSLVCNVFAGRNLGEKLFGVLVVGGFVVAEKYAEKLRAATVATIEAVARITEADLQAAVDAALTAERTQAAINTQAAITAAVDAALAKADRARRAKERREAKRIDALAPVSPATQDEINHSYRGTFEQYAPAYL